MSKSRMRRVGRRDDGVAPAPEDHEVTARLEVANARLFEVTGAGEAEMSPGAEAPDAPRWSVEAGSALDYLAVTRDQSMSTTDESPLLSESEIGSRIDGSVEEMWAAEAAAFDRAAPLWEDPTRAVVVSPPGDGSWTHDTVAHEGTTEDDGEALVVRARANLIDWRGTPMASPLPDVTDDGIVIDLRDPKPLPRRIPTSDQTSDHVARLSVAEAAEMELTN